MELLSRLRIFLVVLAIGSFGMAFTACGDDEDGNGNNGESVERSTEDASSSSTSLRE